MPTPSAPARHLTPAPPIRHDLPIPLHTSTPTQVVISPTSANVAVNRPVTAATSPASITCPGQPRRSPRQDSLFPAKSELQRAPNQPPFLTSQKLGKIRPEFCPKRQYPPCRQYLGSLPLTTTPLHRPFSLARNSSTPPSDTNASFGPPSCTPEIPRPPLQIQTLALDPPHAPPSGPFVLKLSKNPPKKLENRPPAKKCHFSYMQTPKRLDPPLRYDLLPCHPQTPARNSSTPPSDTNASFRPPSCTPETPAPPQGPFTVPGRGPRKRPNPAPLSPFSPGTKNA